MEKEENFYELLENYIDEAQTSLKDKYKVDKVYVPNNLDIVKEITYNQKVSTEKEIYEAIGHDYIYETVEPTCTEDGYYQESCNRFCRHINWKADYFPMYSIR